MIARNVTVLDLELAAKTDPNIEFNRYPEWKGRAINFTLRVKSSRGRFARRGFSGRRMVSLCWHGHKAFFDALFERCPNAKVICRGGPGVVYDGIDSYKDQYQATGYANIGSMFQPLAFSDACDCGLEPRIRCSTLKSQKGGLVETNIKMIRQSDMQKCRFFIMVPTHYREDGSCLCNDRKHRTMMIKEWGYSKNSFDGISLIN